VALGGVSKSMMNFLAAFLRNFGESFANGGTTINGESFVVSPMNPTIY
jgi:hypothetical protein